MTLLVLIEHENNNGSYVLTSQTKELLSTVSNFEGNIIAANLGENIDIESIKNQGVSNLYVTKIQEDYKNISSCVAKFLFEVVKDNSNIEAVFLPSTFIGKESAALLGAKLGVPAITDIEKYEVVDGKAVVNKQVLNGTWTSELKNNSPICVATVKTSGEQQVVASEDLEVKTLEVDFTNELSKITVLSSEFSTKSEVDLENASIVVCGGRGTDGDFTLVHELAEKLGGVVGATRVAADEGWVDRSLQIGQTGRNINAKLYVGLGVSGAVHHTCSLQTCETIVAVCDDEDAPIFEIADFGIVGDINEVVPKLLEELGK